METGSPLAARGGRATCREMQIALRLWKAAREADEGRNDAGDRKRRKHSHDGHDGATVDKSTRYEANVSSDSKNPDWVTYPKHVQHRIAMNRSKGRALTIWQGRGVRGKGWTTLIDVSRLIQINLDTGYVRQIRVIDEGYAPPDPIKKIHQARRDHKMSKIAAMNRRP